MAQTSQGTTLTIDFDDNALDPVVAGAKFPNIGQINWSLPALEVPDLSIATGKMIPVIPGDLLENTEWTADVYFDSAKDWKSTLGKLSTITRTAPGGQKYTAKGYVFAATVPPAVTNAEAVTTLTLRWAGGDAQTPAWSAS